MKLLCSDEGLCFNESIVYPKIEIMENSFSFIVGRSGSGKSSYLKILNRTVDASAGEVYYKNTNIKELPVIEYRRKVMLMPQQVFLFDDTIKANFDRYWLMREMDEPKNDEVRKALDICCADFPLDTNCRFLSGGERQRVFLAIFLCAKPQVLLLDEPTSALDHRTS